MLADLYGDAAQYREVAGDFAALFGELRNVDVTPEMMERRNRDRARRGVERATDEQADEIARIVTGA